MTSRKTSKSDLMKWPYMLLLGTCIAACQKGSPKANEAPETQISIKEINLSGGDRLNSTLSLSWFGTDSDGYIDGYELSFDNQNWAFTQSQDSTFSFTLPAGQDTSDIDFYVRAIDNEGLLDPSPAYLSIPLKNTPPEASFNNAAGPRDTAHIVASFLWTALDPDGDETVTTVEIKVNDGEWQPISLGENLISFVLDPAVQSGQATADLYYGTDNTPTIESIEGFVANGLNTLYIRATDFAGAVSAEDTAETFYLRNKTPGADILWVSGQSQNITHEYRSVLNSLNVPYDLLDYGAAIDGANMPSYWNPTFKLILQQYPKLFVNAGQGTFTNRVNAQTKTLLEFMAPVVQEYENSNGKIFITTSFNKEKDLSEISGPYPVEALITSPGQARMLPDSSLVPMISGNFPALSPTSVQSGMVPIVPTGNSNGFYRAELLKLQGWQGTDIIATIRRPNNIWTHVFFAVELHDYDQDPQDMEQLFEEILINEF